MKPTRQRAREALRSDDFRRLFTIRLLTQSGDGLFQATLIASIVFNPEEQNTILGFAIATLLISLPFSILGPFTGVFIDRWSRRKILVVAPLLRVAAMWLVLFDPNAAPVLFFAGALWVLSVNRFYLATAVAVVPRLVPTEDLLMANSMATVGGTVALLLGVEHDRRDERRLEQPVARLREQPDREQAPEVVAPQGLAGALPGRLHAEDGRRTAPGGWLAFLLLAQELGDRAEVLVAEPGLDRLVAPDSSGLDDGELDAVPFGLVGGECEVLARQG